MPAGGATLDRTFAALADPTRRAILARLAQGEATAGELARPFAMSLPAVSKHLKVLEAAGLMVRRRTGREHRFHLESRAMEAGRDWIDSLRSFWDQQLDRLEEFLDKPEEETDGRDDDR